MGRRSRKRGGAAEIAPAPAAAATPRRPARGERPRAPWHPFPLVELCVLLGLILLVWGFFRAGDASGRVLLVCGMVLASLGGLETALREHFSGFRSHAVVLAALPAVLTAGILFFARAPWITIPVAGAAVLAAASILLRRAFRLRS
jgi:hypothetical protein